MTVKHSLFFLVGKMEKFENDLYLNNSIIIYVKFPGYDNCLPLLEWGSAITMCMHCEKEAKMIKYYMLVILDESYTGTHENGIVQHFLMFEHF